MEVCGLVCWEYDLVDKCCCFVYLIDEGEVLFNCFILQGNEVDDEFFGCLSDDECEQFFWLVYKMMVF